MDKTLQLMLKMEDLEKERRYDFEIIAFCKVHERFITFHLKPMRCLSQFVKCIVQPIYVTDPKVITVTSLRWINFQKCANAREKTMEKNPDYLLSYSVKSGFFDKRERQNGDSHQTHFKAAS